MLIKCFNQSYVCVVYKLNNHLQDNVLCICLILFELAEVSVFVGCNLRVENKIVASFKLFTSTFLAFFFTLNIFNGQNCI